MHNLRECAYLPSDRWNPKREKTRLLILKMANWLGDSVCRKTDPGARRTAVHSPLAEEPKWGLTIGDNGGRARRQKAVCKPWDPLLRRLEQLSQVLAGCRCRWLGSARAWAWACKGMRKRSVSERQGDRRHLAPKSVLNKRVQREKVPDNGCSSGSSVCWGDW